MKKISYLFVLILTLVSCQKEQLIIPPQNNINPPIETTWGYFIPTNAQKDTSIWIDSVESQIWEEVYHNGVKYHEDLVKVDKIGIDTLYVVKTEAYTGADNHREDIFIIKSTKGLDIQVYKNEKYNKNQKIIHFDTLNKTIIFEYIIYSDPGFRRINYHIYKK